MALSVNNLSTYNKFNIDLEERWQSFLGRRQTRLIQETRYGSAAEKVAENIVEDFFTIALDWQLANINNQVKYADIVLTHLGLKRLIIEVKRPGTLSWNRSLLERALEQARRYAQEQRVTTIAVSDGTLFYAVDITNGGLADRAKLHLADTKASPDLWWLSTDGIYRPAKSLMGTTMPIEVTKARHTDLEEIANDNTEVLHPKYRVPARCFAYVGDPLKPTTWKLPYRLVDGSVDKSHLPGAIRAVVSNYRGAHIKTVPEAAIGDVLVRLGRAAWQVNKMPGQIPTTLDTYQRLHNALDQLGRLKEIQQP